MAVKVILFDADGVIQRSSPDRQSLWIDLLAGAAASVSGFLAEVFASERACYVGKGDFTRHMADLLPRWSCSGSLSDALRAWTAIEADRGVQEIIALLRESGHRCYLASNQEPYRARHMSESLAYRSLFDEEFYSCTVGHAKPDEDYFRAILEILALPAEQVLFIDDIPKNVEAAHSIGLRTSVFAPRNAEQWSDHMRDVLAAHDVSVPLVDKE